MPPYEGYYRMPWLVGLGLPLIIWGAIEQAWDAIQPGYVLEIVETRRTAGLFEFLEHVPPPLIFAIFAGGAVVFLVGYMLLALAALSRQPTFRIDSRGVTGFSLIAREGRFLAWPDVKRVRVVQKLAVLDGGRTKIGISLDRKSDREALSAALGLFRPDLRP